MPIRHIHTFLVRVYDPVVRGLPRLPVQLFVRGASLPEVERYFRPIENRRLVPESESEFGYFGHHLVLATPTDVVDEDMEPSMVPAFFELQIKTLFQHAWSEADHDLGYKPGAGVLTSDEKRMIALSSAQAWGADRIFDELFRSRAEASGDADAVGDGNWSAVSAT